MSEHELIERDVAFVTFYMSWDDEAGILTNEGESIGDSLSSYDAEYECTCGIEFDDFMSAREHLKTESKSQE